MDCPPVSERDPRFDLGQIEARHKVIEQAKLDARQREQKNGGPLAALANLPWLIAVLAVSYWLYFK